MKVDVSFLKSKSYSHNVGWNAGVINVTASRTNVHLIKGNIISFTEYNFLPTDGSTLNGHYDFYVNYKTFDYVIFKNSEYGSFTYTLPTKQKGTIKLNEIDKKIIEAKIAYKLLGTYIYDSKYVQNKGTNLISDGRPETKTEYSSGLVLYTKPDGYKLCSLCTYNFKPTENEIQALNILTKF